MALVINYVNSALEVYGIPESQRVNCSLLLCIQSAYSYVSEKLLQSYIPSMISRTIAILRNWPSIILKKSVCITRKNETGFPSSSNMIWDIIMWAASYSLCHDFNLSVHFYVPCSLLHYLELFAGTGKRAMLTNIIIIYVFQWRSLGVSIKSAVKESMIGQTTQRYYSPFLLPASEESVGKKRRQSHQPGNIHYIGYRVTARLILIIIHDRLLKRSTFWSCGSSRHEAAPWCVPEAAGPSPASWQGAHGKSQPSPWNKSLLLPGSIVSLTYPALLKGQT